MVRVFSLGHAGLAMTTSGMALFTSLTLFLLVRAKVEGIYGKQLFDSLWRVLAASAAMAAAVWGLGVPLQSWPYLAQLAVTIPAGVAVFYGAARALRIEELTLATEAFAGPLAKRLGFLNKTKP
jgi:peptidoglycan biosynthesis protein MviN/MurJ (putative lipid II flippase)